MRATWARDSTFWTSVGPPAHPLVPHRPDLGEVGRGRLLAGDGVDHRRLLSGQVPVRGHHHLDVHRVQSVPPPLGDGPVAWCPRRRRARGRRPARPRGSGPPPPPRRAPGGGAGAPAAGPSRWPAPPRRRWPRPPAPRAGSAAASATWWPGGTTPRPGPAARCAPTRRGTVDPGHTGRAPHWVTWSRSVTVRPSAPTPDSSRSVPGGGATVGSRAPEDRVSSGAISGSPRRRTRAVPVAVPDSAPEFWSTWRESVRSIGVGDGEAGRHRPPARARSPPRGSCPASPSPTTWPRRHPGPPRRPA